jgi:ABC-type branched-subunit amino acid transport system ATPase component
MKELLPKNKGEKIVDANAEISQDSRQPMIQSLHIENFRCFKQVDLKDLKRVNVIVGGNGGGKTALLEAIFLSGGFPELVFRMETLRGLNYPPIVQTRAQFESCWKDIFFKLDQSQPIRICADGDSETQRDLKIYYKVGEQMALFPNGKQQGSIEADSTAFIPIIFETKDSSGKPFYQQPTVSQSGGIGLRGAGAPPSPMAFFSSASIPPAAEAAGRFSLLSQNKDDGDVHDTLAKVFPSISNLKIEVDGGGFPALYCDTIGMDRKIPVGLVSTGIHKTLAILLGIATNPMGVILVDEIENGIHYKSLQRVWESLIAFCEKYKTQLFVSSHSTECLKQLIPLLNKNPDNFRLLRTESTPDGSHVVKNFSGRDFEAALETGSEFR